MPKLTAKRPRKLVKNRTIRKLRSQKTRKTHKVRKQHQKMNGGSENDAEFNDLNYGNFAKPGQMGNTLIDQDIEECETQKADNKHEYKYNKNDGECEYKLKAEYFNDEKQKCLMKNNSKSYFTIKKTKKKYVFDDTTGECKQLNNWGIGNNQLY